MGIHTLLHFKLEIKEFTTPKKEILSWPYVTAESHIFGGIEFRYSKREMGHIHGERLADLPFPMTTRNELVNSGPASINWPIWMSWSRLGFTTQLNFSCQLGSLCSFAAAP